MDEQRMGYLLNRYLDKTYSASEKQEFLDLLDHPDTAAALESLNAAVETLPQTGVVMDDAATQAVRTALLEVTGQKRNRPVPFFRRLPLRYAAAALLMLALAGTWWYVQRKPAAPAIASQAQRFKNEVAPGHNGAVLTLSTGQQIKLDSIADGLLAKDGKVQLVKKNGEEIGRAHV